MLEEFRGEGADLVAISPQTLEKSVGTTAERKLGFDLLRDEGNATARAFGLDHGFPDDLREVYLKLGIDLSASNGESSWTLPMPARYIVDTSGTIRYARVHPDYRTRPEPSETLEALRRLTSGTAG